MKKWKKVLIIICTVAVLAVSVFSVTSSALYYTFVPYTLPSFNYAYTNPEYNNYVYYQASSTLEFNKGTEEDTTGQYGYYGDADKSVKYGWRIFKGNTYYEYFQNAVSSKNMLSTSINMAYLDCRGRDNGAFDVGFKVSISTGLGTSSDSMAPSGDIYTGDVNNFTSVKVYYIYDGVESICTISFDNDKTEYVYLSNWLNAAVSGDKPIYVSRIDIDYPHIDSYYTTAYVNIYTGGVDLSSLGDGYYPYNNKQFINDISNKAYQEGQLAGYIAGEKEAYDRGYQAGIITSQKEAYEEGEQAGYEVGWDSGYDKAHSENLIVKKGMFSWIMDSIQGFMQFELFEGFSIGLVLSVIVGLSSLIWILKVIVGG